MNGPSVPVITLFAMVACTQQPPPSAQGTLTQQWLGGGTGPTVVGGSASDTTPAFDGTYKGIPRAKSEGGGSAGPKVTGGSTAPACQRFDQPPTMTITNGLAQFQALGVTFAGYVTPQGHLRMTSGYGPTAEVDFDPQTNTFGGQAFSVNCRYDVAWQKTA